MKELHKSQTGASLDLAGPCPSRQNATAINSRNSLVSKQEALLNQNHHHYIKQLFICRQVCWGGIQDSCHRQELKWFGVPAYVHHYFLHKFITCHGWFRLWSSASNVFKLVAVCDRGICLLKPYFCLFLFQNRLAHAILLSRFSSWFLLVSSVDYFFPLRHNPPSFPDLVFYLHSFGSSSISSF